MRKRLAVSLRTERPRFISRSTRRLLLQAITYNRGGFGDSSGNQVNRTVAPSDTAYTWVISPEGCGSVNLSGGQATFSAAAVGTCTLTVTNGSLNLTDSVPFSISN
jgi:hypothetical protein